MKFLNKQVLFISVLATAVLVLTNSCGVSNQGFVSDDIYVDDEEIQQQEELFARREGRNVYQNKNLEHKSTQYREPLNSYSQSSNEDIYAEDTILSEQNFDIDDYYDYAYAARIKRFHRPVIVYDYYDGFYTDLCWYDADPLLWGTSIYLGYRWWYPSWNYHYAWGWSNWYGYPWGYYNHWYSPWGWNYYAWGYPHHHRGWHAPCYYNSRDRNSNFYRPNYGEGRIARANDRNLGTGYRGEPNGAKNTSFGEKYIQRYGNNASTIRNNNSALQRNNSAIQRGNSTISRNNSNTIGNRITPTNNRLQKPSTLRQSNPNTTQNRNTINRYSNNNVRQGNNGSTINRNNRANINRTYTPPAVRQQRNTNEYRTNNVRPSRNISTQRQSSNSSFNNSSSRSRVSSGSRSSSSSRSSSVSRSSGSSHSSSHSGVSRGGSRR